MQVKPPLGEPTARRSVSAGGCGEAEVAVDDSTVSLCSLFCSNNPTIPPPMLRMNCHPFQLSFISILYIDFFECLISLKTPIDVFLISFISHYLKDTDNFKDCFESTALMVCSCLSASMFESFNNIQRINGDISTVQKPC